MLPVVAIVGRPNVGKSTLFNRLTRTRDALISSYSGMTRDRKFGEVNQADRRFIAVDTGGISNEKEAIAKLITQQALQAIQDADQVLFVIDAKEGLTLDDRKIANLLRKTGKQIVLCINKAEKDITGIISDAHELGLKRPVPISALQGMGIETLVLTLFPEKIEADAPEESLEGIKLAVVGKPNVGKSTLINRMLGEERVIVHDKEGTTRDSIFIPLERFGKKYVLIDTAGVRKSKKGADTPEKFSIVKTLKSIEDANVILYLIDARTGVTEQDLKLLGFVLDTGRALVIALNKWDNMDLEDKEKAKDSIDRELDFVRFARVHTISALFGTGVGNLFDSVEEAYISANKKFSTPQLSKLLEQAVVTHSPPLVKGRRVKLKYAHAGGHNPPRIIIHGTQLLSLPRSYQQFLARFFQRKLKLFGTPVFIEFKLGENPYKKQKRK